MSTWTTKDGRIIEIKNLTDDHLTNILYHLKDTVNGWHKYDLRIFDNCKTWDERCRAVFDEWDDLVDEARSRGLSAINDLYGENSSLIPTAIGSALAILGITLLKNKKNHKNKSQIPTISVAEKAEMRLEKC